MKQAKSNIEAVARDLCERQLRQARVPADELSYAVDRYWHCVAAELEAGMLGDDGTYVTKFDLEQGIDAFRDWHRRHPAV
ncbi:MAG: hypothetical protein FJX55_20915 [Alphaproteobacteria bacterium]|nr:hypothetical protein [Alphaproteobacteria bacterium]